MTLILRQVCLFNIQFGKSLTIDSSFTRVMMWLPLFSSPCKGREAEGGQKQWEEQIWTRSARRMANASSHLKPGFIKLLDIVGLFWRPVFLWCFVKQIAVARWATWQIWQLAAWHSSARSIEKWWERNLATKSTFLKATHPRLAGLRNVRFKMGYKMVINGLWDEDHRWLHLVALNSRRKKSRYCRDTAEIAYKMRLRCVAGISSLHDILGSSTG